MQRPGTHAHARNVVLTLGRTPQRWWSSEGGDTVAWRQRPQGYWKKRSNCVTFMKQLARMYGVEEVSDWRRVEAPQVKALGGHTLLSLYGSTQNLIEEFVPGMKGLDPTRFRNRVPRGWWNSIENRRSFLALVAQKLGIETISDWNSVSRETIEVMGGAGLLARYNFSLNALLRDSLDCADATDAGRRILPPDHWNSMDNRREFFDRLGEELGIRGPEDWARVTCAKVREHGGSAVLARYSGSLVKALQDVYHDQEFVETDRAQVPVRYWDSKENRQRFMRRIAAQHGIESPVEWAKVTRKEFAAMGGNTLLAKFGSLQRVLEETFDDLSTEEMSEYVFSRRSVHSSFWESEENIARFIHEVEAKLLIASPEDWARVSHLQIRQMKGGGLLKKMSLFDALKLVYPNVQWENVEEPGGVRKKTSQRNLFLALRHIVPQTELKGRALHQ